MGESLERRVAQAEEAVDIGVLNDTRTPGEKAALERALDRWMRLLRAGRRVPQILTKQLRTLPRPPCAPGSNEIVAGMYHPAGAGGRK